MSNRKKIKPTAKELIAGGKLPEASVPVCLRGDMQVEFEALERQLEKATGNASGSLAGSGAGELVAKIEALTEQMGEHSIEFRLRALPRPKWKALLAEHPPRKGEDGAPEEADRHIGINIETFFDALIRASAVEPELDDEDWRLLLEERLTDRQFDQLSDAAWALNRRDVDVPFSRAAWRIRNSGSE